MALYHTVNGSPVEVKKHQLIGPVGYTKVGSPSIVDGVASGFSATNYVFANSVLDTSQDFEIFTQLKSGVWEYTFNTIFRNTYGTNPGNVGFVIGIDGASYKIQTFIRDSNGNHIADGGLGKTTFQTNTDYIIRFEQKGYTVNLYSSSDYGETWVLENAWTLSSKIRNSGQGVSFGGGNHSLTNQYFPGEIDLNQTYIKVNDKLWFYQPADTKYIVKDGKLVWADPRISLSGPVNYEVVGSPTIVDGVASGFSSSDYLQLSSGIPNLNEQSSLEVMIKITMPEETWSSSTFICGNRTSNADIHIILDSVRRLFMYIYDNTSSQRMFQYIWAGNVLNPGSTAWIRYKIENGIFTSGLSVDKTNWAEVSLDLPEGFTYTKNVVPILNFAATGSIDLKETYIKVNNELWFYGKNYATQNIAPVPAGYTFGTTTTPSIGYVDMRTQAFTAAPTEATIGREA